MATFYKSARHERRVSVNGIEHVVRSPETTDLATCVALNSNDPAKIGKALLSFGSLEYVNGKRTEASGRTTGECSAVDVVAAMASEFGFDPITFGKTPTTEPEPKADEEPPTTPKNKRGEPAGTGK